MNKYSSSFVSALSLIRFQHKLKTPFVSHRDGSRRLIMPSETGKKTAGRGAALLRMAPSEQSAEGGTVIILPISVNCRKAGNIQLAYACENGYNTSQKEKTGGS